MGGLREARDRVRDGLDEQGARELAVYARQLYVETAHGLVRDVAPVLVTLDDTQLDHLAERLERDSAERRERYLAGNPAERFSRRLERAAERLEGWVGPLRDDQRALLASGMAAMPSMTVSWIRFTEDRQAALLALLRQGGSTEQVVALLEAWWIDERQGPADYREQLEASVDGWIRLAARLDASLDETQRARAVKRLDGYLRALSRLVERTASVAPAAPGVFGAG